MDKNTRRQIAPIVITVIMVIALILFTVTFSIGLPIYARGFYYMHIGPLDMEIATGFDRELIIEGYNEVLDYLTRPGGSFSAGEFAYSDSGAEHFKDCKALFTLNAVVYIISAATVAALLLLRRFKIVEFVRPLGFSFPFWSGIITLLLFAVIGFVVIVDFDTAFYIFHLVLFPGKSNWLFDPYTDEIILAMPEQFFMNCAILIGASVIFISSMLVVCGVLRKRARKNGALK